MFENGYEFKQDFITLLKYFNIKPVLRTIKNPQANASVKLLHLLISNMIVIKDIDNKVFDYIDLWGETLAYIAWVIRAYYQRTIMDTSGKSVCDRDMLLNLASVVDWQVITTTKQQQIEIDHIRESAR